MFERFVLIAASFALVVALGLFWPDALVALLQGTGVVKDWLVATFGITGHLALLFEMGGIATALAMSVVVLALGLLFRRLSQRYFRFSRILTATLLPLLAHVVEWVVGLVAPVLMVPVYRLADWLLAQIDPNWLVTMRALGLDIHVKNLIETTLITMGLLLLWQVGRRLWPRPRRPSATPPSGGTKRKPAMNTNKHSLLNWESEGYWWGPVQAMTYFVLVSVALAAGLSFLFLAALQLLNDDFFGRPAIWWSLWLGLSLSFGIVGWLFTERRSVPNNHVAVLELFGSALPIYLEMGEYLIPFKGILSTNRDMVQGPVRGSQEENSEQPGLVFVGTVTVMLDSEQADGEMLQTIAADGAVNKLLPTFNYTCIDPRKRLGRTDPIRDLNKACREVIRKAVGGITSAAMTAHLQGALAEVSAGGAILFVRTRRSNASGGVHGGDMVVHKATRKPLFEIVHPDMLENVSIKQAFRKKVLDNGDEQMLNAASAETKKKSDPYDHSTIEVSGLDVSHAVHQAFKENGYRMEGLPRISEIDTPEEVKRANAKASAEVPARAGALADAETVRQQGQILKQAGLQGQDAAAAAFLRENPEAGQFVYIAGPGKSSGVIVDTKKK